MLHVEHFVDHSFLLVINKRLFTNNNDRYFIEHNDKFIKAIKI